MSRRRTLVVDDDRSILSTPLCATCTSARRGREGFEILCRVRRRRPSAAVVLFTPTREEALREEALRLGADSVTSTPSPLARLRDATLRAVKKP